MTRPFDPEYDDPTGAGWVISEEYFDDFDADWAIRYDDDFYVASEAGESDNE